MTEADKILLQVIKEYQAQIKLLTETLKTYKQLYREADEDRVRADRNMQKQQRIIDRLKAEQEGK